MNISELVCKDCKTLSPSNLCKRFCERWQGAVVSRRATLSECLEIISEPDFETTLYRSVADVLRSRIKKLLEAESK